MASSPIRPCSTSFGKIDAPTLQGLEDDLDRESVDLGTDREVPEAWAVLQEGHEDVFLRRFEFAFNKE